MYVWNGRKSFSFFLFFFTKVVGKLLPCGASPRATPCPGRSCCSPCALVEPFVTVFSSQPLALPDRTLFTRAHSPPPLVPLPETYSKRLQLLHRSLLADTVSHRAHDFYFSRAIEPLPFPKRRTYARGYLEFYKFFRGSLKNKRIDHRRY